MKKINSLGELLFDQGWVFLAPYFLIYPFFWMINIKTQTAQCIYIVLHVINLFLFICYLPRLLKRTPGWGHLFWIALFFFFLIPGAYLEYPSDPWEHFRRLYSWQSLNFIRDNQPFLYNKGAYFWGWTTLFWVKPIDRRWALDLYSAFWQWLWVFQIYLFARRLGFEKKWAYLQAMAFVFFFGNNLFSFRYYALSTIPIAHIAYLRSLIVIMDFFEGKRRKAFPLLFLFPIIYFNHSQEVIFLILGGLLLILLFWHEKSSPKTQKIINIIVFMIFLGSLGIWILHSFPFYFNQIGLRQLSRVWQYNFGFYEAIGIHGLISYLLAIFFISKYRLIAILTLTPVFLLIFPPSVYLIQKYLIDPTVAYRIIYAMPTSIMLLTGLKEGVQKISLKKKCFLQENICFVITFCLLLALATPPTYPWRGRLFFQVYMPPASNSLKAMDTTAQWLHDNRNYKPGGYLITDSVTDFALTAHLGWTVMRPYWYHRISPHFTFRSLHSLESLLEEMNRNPKAYGYLIGIRNRIPVPPSSLIGEMSRHWKLDMANPLIYIDHETERASNELITMGWKRSFVPPFYYLYELPSNPNNL